jgi:[protein-PII] uridylyltransferase
VATEVSIDGTSSRDHTVIEVIAQDSPGLLLKLAREIHRAGMTISFAKVNTEGNRVIDIFYVSPIDETETLSRERVDKLTAQLSAAV